jgi:hypothetical protein
MSERLRCCRRRHIELFVRHAESLRGPENVASHRKSSHRKLHSWSHLRRGAWPLLPGRQDNEPSDPTGDYEDPGSPAPAGLLTDRWGRIRARWCSPRRAHRSCQLIARTIGQAGSRRPVATGRCRRTRYRPQSVEVRRSRSLNRLRVGYAKERASRRRTREESAAGPLMASGFEAATTLPSAWRCPGWG